MIYKRKIFGIYIFDRTEVANDALNNILVNKIKSVFTWDPPRHDLKVQTQIKSVKILQPIDFFVHVFKEDT